MSQVFKRTFAGAVLGFGLIGSPLAFEVTVSGVDGAVLDNVNALLAPVRESSLTDVRQTYRAQVDFALRKALQALGYYQSLISYTWTEPKGDKPAVLNARIRLGEPVKIAQANLEVIGDGQKDPIFDEIRKNIPKKGTQLNHGEYTDFKSSVERAAMRNGYFDGEFVNSRLGVDAVKNKAYWDLNYDTKKRYRFGKTIFTGSQIRESILLNLLPYEENEPYTADDISELNRRLSATGWFNSVVVSPDLFAGREDPNRALAVDAQVSPKKSNAVETGLGYSTDVGARGSLKWRKPWLNDSGHSLELATELSSLEQSFDASYKLPLEKSALEHYYLFQIGAKAEDLNDTKSNSTTAMVSRYWAPYDGWQRSVHLRWSYDDFEQGVESHDTMLIYPGVSFSKTVTRGGLMPTWGFSQRYTIDVSDTMWGSDVDFLAIEMQHAFIRTFADRHRFVLRSHLGWIETGEFDKVPPDLRFFAGGDRSIRGYDYESISPEDENGDLTGAKKLVTASIEYQYRVKGNWWAAVFFDCGQAVHGFDDFELKKGVGAGIRWQSPLGPIKFDIATPVGDPSEDGIQFYIGLGPEI